MRIGIHSFVADVNLDVLPAPIRHGGAGGHGQASTERTRALLRHLIGKL